eukprot:TRINITY_DN417_c0_g1_i3.p1 TRINITY_DN417_c0_g1~~TRINITY_DN417_c0_g1_i3.p1  ORF type:complete len:378 (+),score=26.83 TRINITY_DN417_c0_g1_i3:203-1336(+)
MMMVQRPQAIPMDWKVTSDNEIIVDRMIAPIQRRGEVKALPSHGRQLVPYFVPGKELSEGGVNVNTDVDSIRRNGASPLDIPVPMSTDIPCPPVNVLPVALSASLSVSGLRKTGTGNPRRGRGSRKGSPSRCQEKGNRPCSRSGASSPSLPEGVFPNTSSPYDSALPSVVYLPLLYPTSTGPAATPVVTPVATPIKILQRAPSPSAETPYLGNYLSKSAPDFVGRSPRVGASTVSNHLVQVTPKAAALPGTPPPVQCLSELPKIGRHRRVGRKNVPQTSPPRKNNQASPAQDGTSVLVRPSFEFSRPVQLFGSPPTRPTRRSEEIPRAVNASDANNGSMVPLLLLPSGERWAGPVFVDSPDPNAVPQPNFMSNTPRQ